MSAERPRTSLQNRKTFRATRVVFIASALIGPGMGAVVASVRALGLPGMLEPILGMGWLVGSVGWLIGRVVRHERRLKEARARLARLRDTDLRLQLVGIGPTGQTRFELSLETAFIPESLRFSRQLLPVPDVRLGDPEFDAAVRVGGEPADASAALHAGARRALRELLAAFPGTRFERGSFHLVLSRRSTPERIVQAAQLMFGAERELESTRSLEERLDAVARTDPVAPVRIKAGSALIAAKGPLGRELAREWIAGDDLQAALAAARALGDVEAEAEVRARAAGARGKLSVSPGDGGELSASPGDGGELSELPADGGS